MTKSEQMSEAASTMAKLRWSSISKKQRAKLVPRNGGRPRKYPKCPRYRSHVFSSAGRCPCGFRKAVAG
jgi:hypothetical protein